MAKLTYIKLFVDYLDAIEPLGDAERGRLFTSLMEYARTGVAPQLNGNERFLFPMMRANIDRDIDNMQDLSDVRSEAGKKGAEARVSKTKQNKQMPNLPGKSIKEKEEEKDKDKDKTGNTPLPPDGKENAKSLLSESDLSAPLKAKLGDWLAYKTEKRESYKPQGLRSLLTQVRKNAEIYGESAVCELIDECMAANWKGIIWDRLDKRPVSHPNAIGPNGIALSQNPEDDDLLQYF